MKIVLSTGHVVLKERFTRRMDKAYKTAMMGDATVSPGADNAALELKLSNMAEAQDVKYILMIDELVVDGKKVEDVATALDELDMADYEKLAKACDDIVNPNGVNEKK